MPSPSAGPARAAHMANSCLAVFRSIPPCRTRTANAGAGWCSSGLASLRKVASGSRAGQDQGDPGSRFEEAKLRGLVSRPRIRTLASPLALRLTTSTRPRRRAKSRSTSGPGCNTIADSMMGKGGLPQPLRPAAGAGPRRCFPRWPRPPRRPGGRRNGGPRRLRPPARVSSGFPGVRCFRIRPRPWQRPGAGAQPGPAPPGRPTAPRIRKRCRCINDHPRSTAGVDDQRE